MFCCTLLYVHSSIAIILMGKRELIALLNLTSWYFVMVERLFLAVPRGCLQFVSVVFPDHTHLLFFLLHLKLPKSKTTCPWYTLFGFPIWHKSETRWLCYGSVIVSNRKKKSRKNVMTSRNYEWMTSRKYNITSRIYMIPSRIFNITSWIYMNPSRKFNLTKWNYMKVSRNFNITSWIYMITSPKFHLVSWIYMMTSRKYDLISWIYNIPSRKYDLASLIYMIHVPSRIFNITSWINMTTSR